MTTAHAAHLARPGGPVRPPRAASDLVLATLRQPRTLAALVGFALVGALPNFVNGQAIARAVDDGFLAGRPLVGLVWLSVLAGAVLVGALGTRRTYLGVAKLAEPLRDQLVRTVIGSALTQSTKTGTARDTGAVARLSKHVETVRETVAGLLLLVLGFVAAIVAALFGMMTLAPVVLPLVVVPLLASFGAFGASLPAVTRQQRRLLVADERLAEHAGDAVGGMRDVVACGGEPRVAALLDRCVDEQVAAERRMARLTAAREVIVSVGGRLPVILVLLSAPWLLERGISAGALIGTLTYLIQGLEPAVSSIVDGMGAPLAQLTMTVRRLDEVAGESAEIGGDGVAVASSSSNGNGMTGAGYGVPRDAELLLRGVTFRYRAAAEPIVDELDLYVPDRDHLAVVGPSGTGKSTLAALLVGMLQPSKGTIRHGGWSPAQVQADFRVLIPQEAYVFRGTVAENLAYYQPDASSALLDLAVRAVGTAELVERLGGYRAPLEPGSLSPGERQLIALARAYLSPARLIILDEATCHLDPTTEAVAEQAFAARDGTLVVIAHRISSAARARNVLLMDGSQTAYGTHDELVKTSPAYRSLVGHWLGDPTDAL